MPKIPMPRVRTALIILALAALASPLAACGVKPNHVGPPPGAQAQQFPHVYPAPDDGSK